MCNHKLFRCTNGIFYCLQCGAEIPNPYTAGNGKAEEEKPAEAKKTASKRKTKKEAD